MYVYLQSEKHEFGGIWTVGHYAPEGTWIPESDYSTKEEAARRVHYLNGGPAPTDPYANLLPELEKRTGVAIFAVDFRGEPAAGHFMFSDRIFVVAESGDFGGELEGPDRFTEHAAAFLRQWFDGATVTTELEP